MSMYRLSIVCVQADGMCYLRSSRQPWFNSFAGITLSSTGSTLTAAGSIVLGTTGSQTLTVNAATTFASTAPITANSAVTVAASGLFSALGSSVLGTSNGSNTLTVNAATTFASTAPITANAPISANAAVTVSAGHALYAYGSTVLGTDGNNSLTVNAVTTFGSSAPITANAAVTVNYGSVFSSLGNTVIGSNTSSTLLIYATTIFSAIQIFSNSSTLASGAVLGFQRQNGAGAVTSGFVLGSILFSGYDGSVEGSTAQIRSVFTVYLQTLALMKMGS